MTNEVQKAKKGFNFKAFLFTATYYAGKGNFKKGLILALIGFTPFTVILAGIYAGRKANHDFKESTPFNWGMAILMVVIHASILNIVKYAIDSSKAL